MLILIKKRKVLVYILTSHETLKHLLLLTLIKSQRHHSIKAVIKYSFVQLTIKSSHKNIEPLYIPFQLKEDPEITRTLQELITYVLH